MLELDLKIHSSLDFYTQHAYDLEPARLHH
jgi:hypothetical protein